MTTLFYAASTIAIAAGFLAVTRSNAVHALLYLVLALFALSLSFLALGAPFVAALEVIVYAGAIMVLILFVIMMLPQGPAAQERERRWLPPRAWIVPTVLALSLATLTIGSLVQPSPASSATAVIGPRAVGTALFSSYLIGVELASLLLLVGLVGAYYLGARE